MDILVIVLSLRPARRSSFCLCGLRDRRFGLDGALRPAVRRRIGRGSRPDPPIADLPEAVP